VENPQFLPDVPLHGRSRPCAGLVRAFDLRHIVQLAHTDFISVIKKRHARHGHSENIMSSSSSVLRLTFIRVHVVIAERQYDVSLWICFVVLFHGFRKKDDVPFPSLIKKTVSFGGLVQNAPAFFA